jgi:PAS domain S-box-containing protein
MFANLGPQLVVFVGTLVGFLSTGATTMDDRSAPAATRRHWLKTDRVLAWLLMVILVAVATAIRLMLGPYLSGAQFPTFFLTIIICSYIGGLRLGLASVVLSLLSVWYFITPLTYSFTIIHPGDYYALAVFTVVGTVMALSIAAQQPTLAAYDRAREQVVRLEERARASDELRRWQDVIDNAAFGLSLNDPRTDKIILANRTFCDMHALSADSAHDRSLFEFYAPEDVDQVRRMRDTADSTGTVDFECYRRRADGSLFPAKVHASAVWGPDKAILYRIVSVFDISAQRASEAVSISELHRWMDVVQNIAFGIGVIDPATNKFSFANEVFAQLHGMSSALVSQLSVFDLYAPEAVDYARRVQQASDRDGTANFEADRLRADGSTFPARIHLTSVRDDDGVLYRILTVRDISAERRLEGEIRHAQQLEAIGQLTAGVAHDFNNLLQGIIGNLELLQDECRETAAHELVESVLRIAEHGAVLTRHLLSYSRQQVLQPRSLDLHKFFSEFRSAVSRTLDPRIALTITVAPDTLPVFADPTYLHTALLNLAINARDAMSIGGTLRTEAANRPPVGWGDDACADGLVGIRVSDTGTGMCPDVLAKACEPFFSTKGLNGTGLGLPMVYGFAKQSGGDLAIESEPGRGTRVRLWLPVSSCEPTVLATPKVAAAGE